MPTRRYPFPFVGAGLAEYFEWCAIYICFENAPDEKTIKKIKKIAPPLLFIEPEDVHGRIILAGSDQFVNVKIEEMYGRKNKRKPKVEEGDATAVACAAFEKDIERWLKSVHKLSPIEIAFRREDDEAGGTKLSDWHNQSVRELTALFGKWALQSPDDYSDDGLQYFVLLMQGLQKYHKIQAKGVLERFLVNQYVFELLSANQSDTIEKYLHKKITREVTFERVANGVIQYLQSPKCENTLIVQVVRRLINSKWFLHYMLYHNRANNHALLIALIEQKEGELLDKVMNLIRSVPREHYHLFVHPIYYDAFTNLQPQKRWDLMIPIYDFLVELMEKSPKPLFDRSFYCNILWVLQKDNTGLPVNKELNRKFLNVCLPQGVENPAIYYNAACLYNEMEEYNEAVHYISTAVEGGINAAELQGMVSDLTTADVFKTLRDRMEIRELLARLK